MPNSIAVFLGIALTFYIVFLIGGVVGVGLLLIIFIGYFIIAKNLDSHDKRFNKIVEISAKNNTKTNGEEYNIKPIKFKDELDRTRYNYTNYEEKNSNRIIISKHFLDDVATYKTYRVEIENGNGDAFIHANLIESITRA